MLSPRTITTTGVVDLGVGGYDQAFVNGMVVTIYGFTGSLYPQKKQALGNIQGFSPNYFNCAYFDANAGTPYTAGTPLTTDMAIVVEATGHVVALNVTDIGDGSFTVVCTPYEGSLGSASSGTSGTIVGTDSDNATNSTTKLPVIPGRANAADPSWTEGHEVPLSVTLAGYQRVAAKQIPGTATVTQVSLTTSAAIIVAANTARQGLVIKNIDASIVVYIGATGVTSSTGYPLAAGESVALSISSSAWYGVAASSTPKVAAIEV